MGSGVSAGTPGGSVDDEATRTKWIASRNADEVAEIVKKLPAPEREKLAKALSHDAKAISRDTPPPNEPKKDSNVAEALLEFKDVSKGLAQQVRQQLSGGESPWEQNPIYKGMGMQHMLKQAAFFKQDFDLLCEELVGVLKKGGIDASFIPVPVKSQKSAVLKVGINYNGDVCQLTDAVRGTICIKGAIQRESFAKVYDALKKMLEADQILENAGAKFTHFADRYQSPLGEYRDWLFLIRMKDFVCELQVNLQEALDRKEAELHQRYEESRLAKAKLLEGAMRGDAQLVELMIKAGGSVKSRDQKGSTPLHYAARHGSEQMVAALLDAGADVLAADETGCTALYHAIVMRHESVVRMLLPRIESRKQDLPALPKHVKMYLQRMHSFTQAVPCTFKDEGQRIGDLVSCAFGGWSKTQHAAAFNGDVRALKSSLAINGFSGDNFSTAMVQCDCQVLDMAVMGGSVATAKICLKKGLYGDGPHSNPLEAAKQYIKTNQPASLMALLAVSKKLKENNKDLSGLMMYAIEFANFNAANVLMEHGARLTQEDAAHAGWALCKAAGTNDVRVLKMLLEAGVLPNDQERVPAIHWAASGGFLDCLRVLVDAKADVNIMNDHCNGQTALVYAVEESQKSAIEFLLEAGASKTTNDADQPWHEPAGLAVTFGMTDFIPYMIDIGFEFIDTKWDLIKWAQQRGFPEIAKLLTEHRSRR